MCKIVHTRRCKALFIICIKQRNCTKFIRVPCINRQIHPFASQPICSLMGFQNTPSSGRDVAKHDTLLSAKKRQLFQKNTPILPTNVRKIIASKVGNFYQICAISRTKRRKMTAREAGRAPLHILNIATKQAAHDAACTHHACAYLFDYMNNKAPYIYHLHVQRE